MFKSQWGRSVTVSGLDPLCLNYMLLWVRREQLIFLGENHLLYVLKEQGISKEKTENAFQFSRGV